jgi:hypothetical protein
LDGEAIVIDELVPLPCRADKKDGSQQNGGCKPHGTQDSFAPIQRRDSEVYGNTARKQANGGEDWEFENLLWRRSTQALADVIDVGNDKDDEDRGFGYDEAGYTDNTARGQLPIFASRVGYERRTCIYFSH